MINIHFHLRELNDYLVTDDFINLNFFQKVTLAIDNAVDVLNTN